jgi:ketosteroid isomerase-like protein
MLAATHRGSGRDQEVFEQRTQRSMEAMSRKDVAAVMRSWADDAVLEFTGHTPISGRYEGRPAVEDFFRRVFAELETIQITVRHVAFANPVGLNYNNTVYVESAVDATSLDGVTIHDERIAVLEYSHGKVVSMREWAFDPTILDALWGPEATPA